MKKHTFLICAALTAGLMTAAGLAGCSGTGNTGTVKESETAEEGSSGAEDNEGVSGEEAGEEGGSGQDSAEETVQQEPVGPARIQIDVRETGTDYRDENDGHVLVHLTNTELSPDAAADAAFPQLAGRLKSISGDDLTYEQSVLKKAVKACMDEYAAHSETFTTLQAGIDVTMGRSDEEIVSFMKREYSDLDGESPFWTYQGFSIDPKSGDSIKLGSVVADQELLPELVASELMEHAPETYARLCPPPPETEKETAEETEAEEAEDGESTADEETEAAEEAQTAPDPAVVKAVKDCIKRYSGNGENLWMVTPEGLTFYFGPYALGAGSSEQILTIRQEDHPELFKLSAVNYPQLTVRNRAEERPLPAENLSVSGVYSAFDVDKDRYPELAKALDDFEADAAGRTEERLDGLEKEAQAVTDGSEFRKEIRITAENVTADVNTLSFEEVTALADSVSGEVQEESRTAVSYDIRTGKKK